MKTKDCVAFCFGSFLFGAMLVTAILSHAVFGRPCEETQRQASVCVDEAFNFLHDKQQHRIFSNLRKALELDPKGAVPEIIECGKIVDEQFGPLPMPKPLVGRGLFPSVKGH